jgi:hypothetical protein
MRHPAQPRPDALVADDDATLDQEIAAQRRMGFFLYGMDDDPMELPNGWLHLPAADLLKLARGMGLIVMTRAQAINAILLAREARKA